MNESQTIDRSPLLDVERLTVSIGAGSRCSEILHNISFRHSGGLLALVGESGSGKTMTARTLLGLTPPSAKVEAATLAFEGRSLPARDARDWLRLRGSRMALVQQDPRYALNPVRTIAWQVEEGLRLHHRGLTRAERRERVEAMLQDVGLPADKKLLSSYPYALSGGMGQRVMLAASLICQPRLLIADEPTSALDENLRRQILDLIARLASEREMGVLLISHDLPLVARYCERALVMRRGRILEDLPAGELARASHPYTRLLWSCQPGAETYGQMLPVMSEQEDD